MREALIGYSFMANTKINIPTSAVIDPQRDGYDTNLWHTVSGSPSVSADKFLFNVSEGLLKPDLKEGIVAFKLTIPVKPTAGHARQWGLKNLSLGNKGKIVFDITGTVFSIKSYDDAGTVESSTVVWRDTAWTNKSIEYKIMWTFDRLIFFIDGEKIASHKVSVGTLPLSVFISNAVADALTADWITLAEMAYFSQINNPAGEGVKPSGVATFVKVVAAAGTAEQLPSFVVPESGRLAIKALDANTGTIYIGDTKADAENTSVAMELTKNQSITLNILNANSLWVNAAVNGEGLAGIVEQL